MSLYISVIEWRTMIGVHINLISTMEKAIVDAHTTTLLL